MPRAALGHKFERAGARSEVLSWVLAATALHTHICGIGFAPSACNKCLASLFLTALSCGLAPIRRSASPCTFNLFDLPVLLRKMAPHLSGELSQGGWHMGMRINRTLLSETLKAEIVDPALAHVLSGLDPGRPASM
jgi:hypothetical protein